MKKINVLLSSLLLAGSISAVQAAPQKPASPEAPPAEKAKPSKETVSKDAGYYFGYTMGRQLSQMAPGLSSKQIDMQSFIRGMESGLAGEEPATDMPIERVKESLQVLQSELQAEAKKSAEQNLLAGEKFLEANKTKEGVKTLPGGIQYKVVTAGQGQKMPAAKDGALPNYRCMVAYKGQLLDGKVFDDSKGEAIPFPVNSVIPGFQEVLKAMPVGSTWEVWIPADKAYGEQPPTPSIPPNSTLNFVLTLKSIEEPAKEEAPGQIDQEAIRKMLEQQQQLQGGGAPDAGSK